MICSKKLFFFLFNVKIIKEVRLSENSLILLEIQIVCNNGGQKHSLSIDVRCPVSGKFFLCCAESMNSGVHYPGTINFISIIIAQA